MADITMCNVTDCPVKEKCHRFTADANPYRQSWFTEPPFEIYDNGGGIKMKCDMFWGEDAEVIINTLKDILK